MRNYFLGCVGEDALVYSTSLFFLSTQRGGVFPWTRGAAGGGRKFDDNMFRNSFVKVSETSFRLTIVYLLLRIGNICGLGF